MRDNQKGQVRECPGGTGAPSEAIVTHLCAVHEHRHAQSRTHTHSPQACTHLHTHTPFFTGTCPESAQGGVTQHPDPPESFLTIVMALYIRFGAWLVSQRAFKPQRLQSMNKNSCPSFQQKLTCSASYTRVSMPWARVVSGQATCQPLEQDRGTGHSRRIQSRREAMVSGDS